MSSRVTLDPPAPAATLTGQLAAADLRAGDVLAGRFRIVALLGIGGFGFVYRARDLSLDVDVALKLLRPELARRPEAFERFRQELLLARQVSSANVVRIHDITQHDGRWFISMDLIEGESLDDRLARGGRLATDEAIAITRGLLAGLQAAHARGVVHRDLKPANILLDRGGNALISDFGIARSVGASGMTQSGALVGTPEYLSPEQARGERVDARSDLYAVGLILYETLCGAPPFSGGTPAETVIRRIVAPPASLARARPDLPRWLHAFCERLLKTQPAQRFADARDALRALDERRVPRAPLPWRRLAAATALVLLLGAGAFVAWREFAAARPAIAAATSQRVALLPLRVAGDDAELHALARALETHAQAWLRGDGTHAVAPRRRVLDALARQTPGLADAALLRQLPDIARAAGAAVVVHGELRAGVSGLALRLQVWRDGIAAAAPIEATGSDAASLFADYVRRAPLLFAAAGLRPGAAPALPPDALAGFGRALVESDTGEHAAAAADALAALARTRAHNALLDAALLDAQGAAGRDVAAQSTRDRIVQQYGGDTSLQGRELYARALVDDGTAERALPALAAALHDAPDDSALNLLDAQALADAGNGAQALTVLRHAVAVDAQDARAWFLLGRTAIQQGEAEVAVSDYLTRALVLDRLRGDRAAEAETSNALGVGYERLGRLDAAADQYGIAAAAYEKLGDDVGLAKALRNLAIVQAVRGDTAAADATLERVRKLLEKNHDRGSLADLYNDRGVVAEEHGDYRAALAFYRQALALRQELDEPGPLADSLNNVGFASYSLGDFDNALVFWQQALAQYRKVDDANGALRIDESIGLLEIARGRFGDARARLAAALQNAEDHQLGEEAAVAQVYLGQLDLHEARLADAQAAAARAAEIFAQRNDKRGTAEAALLGANVALALGDGDGADARLRTLAADDLGAEQRAMLQLALAQRARLAGDRAATAARLAAAGRSADPHSSIGLRVRLEAIRAQLAAGDVAGAAQALKALRGETVRLAEVPVRLDWLELEIAAALRSGDAAAAASRYREALALLRTTGRFGHAIVLHRLGARALAAAPADAQAARAAADALAAQALADAPPARRDALHAAIERRWREEAGEDHG